MCTSGTLIIILSNKSCRNFYIITWGDTILNKYMEFHYVNIIFKLILIFYYDQQCTKEIFMYV